MNNVIRNGWYMAAWSTELPGDGVLSRRLLDRQWALWRTADGVPVMMEDRCPHRFVPLSRGRREGDLVHCAYHGLAFDRTGACAHNPFTGQPHAQARVAVLPLVERHGGVWFWPGEADQADPTLIPDFSFLDDDAPRHWGHMTMEVDHELVIDNLMDLSHAEFIHTQSFGTNGSLLTHGAQDVRQDADGAIWNNWTMTNAEPPAWAAPMLADGARVDQWLHIRWMAPSSLALHIGLAHPGTDRTGLVVPAMVDPHILTPETGTSTHYFYTHGLTERDFAMLDQVFHQEDHPILLAQQKAMAGADFWALKPLILPSDAGAVRVRRRRMQLLRREQEALPA